MKPKGVSAPGMVEIFRIAHDNKLYDGWLLSAFNENAQYWINKSTASFFPHSACPSPLLPFSVEIPQIGRAVEKQDLHREDRGHISIPAFSY